MIFNKKINTIIQINFRLYLQFSLSLIQKHILLIEMKIAFFSDTSNTIYIEHIFKKK